MSDVTLKAVLRELTPQVQCDIYTRFNPYVPILIDAASESQLKYIITSIDEVSNGSGLQIVSLFLWPHNDLPEVLKPLADEILSNLTAINA